jgi:phosphate starvation-inducible protein PhoH
MARNFFSNGQSQQKRNKKQRKAEAFVPYEAPEPDFKKKFTGHDIKRITPLTDSQMYAFQEWAQGQNIVLEGFAGTGKTFLSLYLALHTVFDPSTPQDKIIIIRSSVPTREIGHLPGTESEKNSVYESPYIQICDQLFHWRNSYKNLKDIGIIEFHNTSFLRGMTFDNAVVIFDEFQSATDHEETTVASRIGTDSRLIVCGDDLQNDIGRKSGGNEFIRILRKMQSVSFIDFALEDIVRGGFCKEFLMAKYG